MLDDTLLSAPGIQSTITSDGQITGGFTEEQVKFLVGVLNAGSLPAALRPEPISQEKISAQMGDDTIRQGSNAMIASTVAVLVFMLVYYRFAGAVADLAVVMNMILAVALMILIRAAFTLPGLAGLVLTVGMAVDANVLIYERMREEAARGASFRMTIRNGFSRAMATIIDSNTTTVISAVVLYMAGTDQVKGFAVTLILGLVVSLYTAIYVARLIFDIVERKRWVTSLHMMQMIGETKIDFVRWRTAAISFSCVVLAIGLVAVIARGADLFDIDFTGGVSVQIRFHKPQDIGRVREVLSTPPNKLEDLAVSAVGIHNLDFKIDTSEKEITEVQKTLKSAFGDDLATYTMKFSDLQPFTPKEPSANDKVKADENAPADVAGKAPAKSSPAATSPPASTPPAKAPAAETPSTSPATEPKPDADKPAADNPATEEPANAKASDAKPPADAAPAADNKAGKSAAMPTINRGRIARWVAPAMLAVMLAADDAKAAPAASDSAPAAENAPAEPADKKTDAADQAEAPSTPPAATTAPQTDLPAIEATPPLTPAASGGDAKATRVKLSFEQPISYDGLRPMIERWLTAHDLAGTRFELLNPKHKPNSSGTFSDWTLEIQLSPAQTQSLLTEMQTQLADTPVFPSSNSIGTKVAGNTQLRAVLALLASMVMIVIYVWIRFQNIMFGVAAVAATFHDVLVAVGFLALSKYLSPFLGFAMVDDFKISLAVVAALLTIVGYSINDTIVIFDRIREIRGKNPDLTEAMINNSVNQCLGRTILTSGTVLIGTMILYFFGGQGIHPFAYAMLVGLISGTYSTVYIASPMLLLLRRADETRGDVKPGGSTRAGLISSRRERLGRPADFAQAAMLRRIAHRDGDRASTK